MIQQNINDQAENATVLYLSDNARMIRRMQIFPQFIRDLWSILMHKIFSKKLVVHNIAGLVCNYIFLRLRVLVLRLACVVS